jgi:hypothetical protein
VNGCNTNVAVASFGNFFLHSTKQSIRIHHEKTSFASVMIA